MFVNILTFFKSLTEKSLGLLKGSDRAVVLAKRYELRDTWNEEFQEISRFVVRNFNENDDAQFYNFEFKAGWIDTFLRIQYEDCTDVPITWCQDVVWEPALVSPHYEREMDFLYQTTAILITIPRWSERKTSAPQQVRKLVSVPK